MYCVSDYALFLSPVCLPYCCCCCWCVFMFLFLFSSSSLSSVKIIICRTENTFRFRWLHHTQTYHSTNSVTEDDNQCTFYDAMSAASTRESDNKTETCVRNGYKIASNELNTIPFGFAFFSTAVMFFLFIYFIRLFVSYFAEFRCIFSKILCVCVCICVRKIHVRNIEWKLNWIR